MSIDLNSYLEQQLLKEENCVSMYTRFAGIVGDAELRKMFHEFGRQAQAHRDTLRSILERQGMAQDGVIQNRVTGEAMFSGFGVGQSEEPPVRGRDEDMVADSLLTMRAMSESYRSLLRLVSDEGVAEALIGMRKDEDRQKEQLARYLHQHR
ncbi:MAG: ferritin-like domain-containing protein [Bacillota bacterium]